MTEPSGVDDGSVAFSDWFTVLDEDFPTNTVIITWNKGHNGDISLVSWLERKIYASHITSIYAIVE